VLALHRLPLERMLDRVNTGKRGAGTEEDPHRAIGLD
jgi:hypothetical protein